jgi:multimeric flavodoxin WrbA
MTEEKQKIVTAFLGSARSTGTTNWMLNKVQEGFNKFKDENMHFNKVDLYKYEIKPIARSFIESTEQKIPSDGMKELVPVVLTSRVILLATPIYWFTISGITKNFLDRWYDFSDEKGKLNLDGKGLAVVTAHANPSSTMSHQVFKMMEESAKFCNMVYLGGADTVTAAQPGSNEYEIASISAELLGKRIADYLRHSI